MNKKPFAWSYTALTAFENCPKQFWHTRVARDVPDPPGEAALWGQRVHKALENRIKEGTSLPPSIAHYEPYAARFVGLPAAVEVEKQLCFTRRLRPTAWFAKDAWLRVVIDVIAVSNDRASLVDWKTGKRKPDNEQLKLFAGATFLAYPDVSVAHTSFAWLKDRASDNDVFTRKDAPAIWRTFLPRVKRMEQAYEAGEEAYPPKPSGLCHGWCPVKSCKFWTPRK